MTKARERSRRKKRDGRGQGKCQGKEIRVGRPSKKSQGVLQKVNSSGGEKMDGRLGGIFKN